MQKKTFRQRCLAWIISLAVAVTFIPTSAGLAFAADSDGEDVVAVAATVDISSAQVTLEYDSIAADSDYHYPKVDKVQVGEDVVPAEAYDVSYPDTTRNAYKKAGTHTVRVTAKDDSGYTGQVDTSFEIKVDVQSVSVYKVNGTSGVQGNPIKVYPKSSWEAMAKTKPITYQIKGNNSVTNKYIPTEDLFKKAGVKAINAKDQISYVAYDGFDATNKVSEMIEYGYAMGDGGTVSGKIVDVFGSEYVCPGFLIIDRETASGGSVSENPRSGMGFTAEGDAPAGNRFLTGVTKVVLVSMDIANLQSKADQTKVTYGKQVTATAKDGDTEIPVEVVSSSKAVGPATAKVKVKDEDASPYYGTATVKYTIVPKGTKVKYVLNNGWKTLRVKWYRQKTQTSGYQVRYSTTKDFSKNVKTKRVSGNNKNAVNIKNLKKKTTYYVQVRTYKTVKGKNYYSTWTPVEKHKTH